MALLARFDHDAAPVIGQREIMIVAGEHHIRQPRAHQRHVAGPVGMRHGDDELRALPAERRRLAPKRLESGREPQIAGLAELRGRLQRQPDHADPDPAQLEDAAVSWPGSTDPSAARRLAQKVG